MVSMFIEDPPYITNAKANKFDVLGMLFLILWIATFQVMVDNGQKNGWFDSPYICKLGISSLISFVALKIASSTKSSTDTNFPLLVDIEPSGNVMNS